MSRCTRALALLAWVPAFAGMTTAAQYPGVGRPATPSEIAAWDIDVRPDFKGLPPGSGSVAQGQAIWDAQCASCHGTFGESNEVFAPLVGGTTAADMKTGRAKALVKGDSGRTTLMKLPNLSTLWDYVRRAMPWNAPKSLTPDQVYAVVAYMLNLGDIVPGDFVLSERNMAEVQARLPNRNGMTREHGLWDVRGKPDVRNVACMKDCPTEAQVTSALPDHARDSHGNLSQQQRAVGPVRGTDKAPAVAAVPPAPVPVAELARTKACMSCHGVEKALVGPSFRDIAARYRGKSGADAELLAKMRRGGSGVWGPLAMPPMDHVAEADLRSLLAWILSGSK